MTQKKQKNNFFDKKINIAILVLLVIAISALATIKIYQSSIIETQSFEAHINAGDYVGMNADTDKLWFGTIIAENGGVSTRKIIYENSNDFDVKIKFKADGPIAQFISIPEEKFIISKQSSASFTLAVQIPPGTQKAEYEGTVYLIVQKN